jgi:hypothetical protein
MDPNANLDEQAILLTSFVYTPDYYDARRLSELRHALREWISRGGFEPDWSKHPDAARLYRAWLRRKRSLPRVTVT